MVYQTLLDLEFRNACIAWWLWWCSLKHKVQKEKGEIAKWVLRFGNCRLEFAKSMIKAFLFAQFSWHMEEWNIMKCHWWTENSTVFMKGFWQLALEIWVCFKNSVEELVVYWNKFSLIPFNQEMYNLTTIFTYIVGYLETKGHQNLMYYYINRSQRHLLAANENNWLGSPIRGCVVIFTLRMIYQL